MKKIILNFKIIVALLLNLQMTFADHHNEDALRKIREKINIAKSYLTAYRLTNHWNGDLIYNLWIKVDQALFLILGTELHF